MHCSYVEGGVCSWFVAGTSAAYPYLCVEQCKFRSAAACSTVRCACWKQWDLECQVLPAAPIPAVVLALQAFGGAVPATTGARNQGQT